MRSFQLRLRWLPFRGMASSVDTLSSQLAMLVNASISSVLDEMRAALAANPFSDSLMALSLRIAAGQPSRVRLVGGSVTVGTGHKDWAPGGEVPRRFSDVLERAMRAAWPNVSLDFDQFATGGVGSSYYSSCLEDMVPRDTDLVVLDLSINDIERSSGERSKSCDAIIDQLHGLRVGAVLMMNWRESPFSPRFGSAHYMSRHRAAVRGNWGIASEIARSRANVSSVKPFELAPKRPDFWDQAGLHPSYFGHLLIGLYLALLLTCAGDGRFSPVIASARSAATEQPRRSAQYQGQRSVCFTGAMLATVAQAGIGWNLTDEGRGKWGYVGTSAHGRLALFGASRHGPVRNATSPLTGRDLVQRLDAGRGVANRSDPYSFFGAGVSDSAARDKLHEFARISVQRQGSAVVFWVEVGYLRSYGEEYGQLLLSCGHCECYAFRGWWPFPAVDTRDPTAEASEWASTIFAASCATDVLQATGFRLVIQQNVSGAAGGVGSKVKLLGVKLHPPNVLQ